MMFLSDDIISRLILLALLILTSRYLDDILKVILFILTIW